MMQAREKTGKQEGHKLERHKIERDKQESEKGQNEIPARMGHKLESETKREEINILKVVTKKLRFPTIGY